MLDGDVPFAIPARLSWSGACRVEVGPWPPFAYDRIAFRTS
jgi:hypothetical protein